MVTEVLQEKVDFQQAQANQNRTCPFSDRGSSLVKWTRPTEFIYKANWCVAIARKNNKLGFGIVIRNSNGDVTVALCTN